MRLTLVQPQSSLTFDHLLFQWLSLDFHLDQGRRSEYKIYWSATPLCHTGRPLMKVWGVCHAQSRFSKFCQILIKIQVKIWSISNLWNIAVNTKDSRFSKSRLEFGIERDLNIYKCTIYSIIKSVTGKILKFTNFREVLGFKIRESQKSEIFVYPRFGSWRTPRESRGSGVTVQPGTDEKQGMKYLLFLTSKL